MSAGGTAFDRALDLLGRSIVGGELPADHADTIEGLVEHTGASRSVVREVSRVLTSLGMLSAGRRVGLRVLAQEHWDVLDPLVIRWRLDGPEPQALIDELRALRLAIEPAAAAAAATRAGRRDRGATRELEEAAADLRDAADEPEAAAFLRADRALHAAVLDLSANTLFTRLRAVVDEGLQERALRERAELLPDPHDLALHLRVTEAILAGEPGSAASAMREIVERTSSAHP
ncbi:FadR/GntR family transcriptional regulator [Brachybacterium sacelli]|uniref:DNA-binding FadR family transcriptional regulator n=1 Tax=Brachybacterium sacelli TaxID=173364 RepID=A0ABS4WXE2_9MICO|nr:FCD domain-containing protein [Brachybacterium sacelli]MBP2380169.1 DNA-binding FadR family transcriptional regulator [Brachybacterium sacelli]